MAILASARARIPCNHSTCLSRSRASEAAQRRSASARSPARQAISAAVK